MAALAFEHLLIEFSRTNAKKRRRTAKNSVNE